MEKKEITNLHNVKELEWNRMLDTERISFLEQLMEDDDAIERMTVLELVPMPNYLEKEILEAVLCQETVENVALSVGRERKIHDGRSRMQKRFRLFSYSLKIASAAVCAIVILFRIPEVDAMTDFQQRSEEWVQEKAVREEAAEKRHQEILMEREKRYQPCDGKDMHIVERLQYFLEKIFVEE